MPTTVDGFEDGDLSEYGGDTAQFEANQEDPRSGSFAAHSILNDNSVEGNTSKAIVRDSPTVDVGDVPISLFGKQSSSNGPRWGLVFGAQSVTGISNLSGYVFHTDQTRAFATLSRFDNGSRTDVIPQFDTSVSLTSPSYIELVVSEWQSDGTITVEVREDGTTTVSKTVTDTTYTSGLLGLYSRTRSGFFGPVKYAEAYYDDLTTPTLLSAPSNVSTSVTQDDVTVSWDAADGASKYNVLRAQSSGTTASDYTTIATVTDDGSASFSVTDTGLEDGEKFFYRVESVS